MWSFWSEDLKTKGSDSSTGCVTRGTANFTIDHWEHLRNNTTKEGRTAISSFTLTKKKQIETDESTLDHPPSTCPFVRALSLSCKKERILSKQGCLFEKILFFCKREKAWLVCTKQHLPVRNRAFSFKFFFWNNELVSSSFSISYLFFSSKGTYTAVCISMHKHSALLNFLKGQVQNLMGSRPCGHRVNKLENLDDF
jgi:hypothetical protein